MTERMAGFLIDAEERGVICLHPQQWDRLWEMLPGKTRKSSGWDPPLPLILDGWWYSDDDQKKERFLSHLSWADANGAADEVLGFLESLTPDDWYKGKGRT